MRNGECSHLQACLLLLLAERSDYGYGLVARLSPFGLADIDTTTAYRALRALEAEGCVSSQWVPSRSGPARRIYHLSSFGRSLLASCGERLRREYAEIAHYLACFDAVAARWPQQLSAAAERSRAPGGRN